MIEEMVDVACYAGSRYPQRPLRVTWRGAEREVLAVEREWQEPRRRCSRGRLDGDRRRRLSYYQRNERWTGAEVGEG